MSTKMPTLEPRVSKVVTRVSRVVSEGKPKMCLDSEPRATVLEFTEEKSEMKAIDQLLKIAMIAAAVYGLLQVADFFNALASMGGK